jgi:hypothetical protein
LSGRTVVYTQRGNSARGRPCRASRERALAEDPGRQSRYLSTLSTMSFGLP